MQGKASLVRYGSDGPGERGNARATGPCALAPRSGGGRTDGCAAPRRDRDAPGAPRRGLRSTDGFGERTPTELPAEVLGPGTAPGLPTETSEQRSRRAPPLPLCACVRAVGAGFSERAQRPLALAPQAQLSPTWCGSVRSAGAAGLCPGAVPAADNRCRWSGPRPVLSAHIYTPPASEGRGQVPGGGGTSCPVPFQGTVPLRQLHSPTRPAHHPGVLSSRPAWLRQAFVPSGQSVVFALPQGGAQVSGGPAPGKSVNNAWRVLAGPPGLSPAPTYGMELSGAAVTRFDCCCQRDISQQELCQAPSARASSGHQGPAQCRGAGVHPCLPWQAFGSSPQPVTALKG